MKSIIVTGASGNMGQAVVKRFAQDSQKVYAVLSPGENPNLFNESGFVKNIEVQLLNLTDEIASENYVKEIVAKDPAVESAVCLVGGWHPGTLSETRNYELEKMFKLNFFTVFNITRPLMEHFERRGGGQFIFIGARPAINLAEGKNQVAYALSKSLLFRLAEIINDQGKSKNIRASIVIPSILDTPQNRAAMPDADASRWVTPESAADAIAFILSDTGSAMRETVIKLYGQA